jgi:hypothetical protein
MVSSAVVLPSPKPPSAVRVIFGAIILVGSVVFAGLGVPGVVGARADQALRETEGNVLSVSSERRRLLTRGRSPNSPTHENLIEVKFRYQVDGKPYEGREHAFDEPREIITDDAEAKRRIAELRAAKRITVLYDPADPSRAVLDRRELPPALAVSIVGGVGLLVSLWLLLGWWRDRRAYLKLAGPSA